MHWLVKVTENKSEFALMFFSRSFCLKNISLGNKIAFNNPHDPALTLSLVFIYFQKNYFSFELFYKRYFLFDELDAVRRSGSYNHIQHDAYKSHGCKQS